MRILLAMLGLMAAGTMAGAAVQSLPFYDAVNYPEGQLYAVGAGFWDAGGNAGNEITVSNAAALLAPAGLINATGKGIRWAPSGTARRSLVQFTPVTGGTLYASFLVNVGSAPSSARLVAYFDSSTSQPSSPQLGLFVGNGSVGIGKKASSPAATVAVGSGTHFIVVRYTFTGTTSDVADLWVDPVNTAFGAANAPAASASTSGGSNPASLPYFGIYAASGAGPTVYIDEVRVGTDWASVTPPSGVIAPPATAPSFTQHFLNGVNVVLRGTNGAPGGGYEILWATNLTLPLAQWSVVGSNTFNGLGQFDFTNAASPVAGQAFYRLRMGGSTNVTVAVAPFITSQPQNQTAAVGQGALFSVGVGGSEPLRYQWYFNTNTALVGATNSSYQISGVTSNDAGAYSVTITNVAGSTNSSSALLSLAPPPTDGDYFVSTTGNDANPGSIDLPFATVAKAIAVVGPGQTIYVRGGTYFPSQTMNITNSGTPGNLIKLWAYPGEQPVLDFVNQPYGAANRGFVLKTNGNFWHFKGLEIARAGDNAIKVESSHCKFERLTLHHNGDTGLQIGFAHETVNPGANLAAFIEVINCDSYLNFDPDSNGGDADGFAAKLHCGQGIVFSGCRAWENSDDSWDLFETDASVVITNCWGWRSGVGQGNGNGFKLGGNGSGGNSAGTHYAYNCVAFGHKVNGFTQNSHKDGVTVIHCLSFANGASGYNYFMEGSLNSGKQNVFKNNVSIPRSGVNTGGFIADNNPLEQHNTWNLVVTATAADFADVTEAAAKAPRNPDGSLPTGFARLVFSSDLIDKGVDVGIPYTGAAPDLGAYELP